MKVAVTGASGHIGNCLVRKLIERGYEVSVLVHQFNSNLHRLNVCEIQGNLLQIDTLHQLCKGAEVVFHLAAKITIDNKNADEVYAINVKGTQNILDAALEQKITKFIHFSSIHAFLNRDPSQLLDESSPLNITSKSMYESTKAKSEELVSKAVERGLHAVVLCPTAVIGPFDYRQSLLGQAIQKMYANSLPMLVKGGYNWVDVRDVVDGAIKAMEKGEKGEKYILSGTYCSLKELSVLLGNVFNRKTPRYEAPISLARFALPFIQVFSSLTHSDPLYTSQSLEILTHSPQNISNQKAQQQLGYTVKPLSETLRDTINWYKSNSKQN